jgi:hypothetical protein
MEALGETSCFAQSRKQMERFTRGARHLRDMRDWVLDRSTKRRGPGGPLRGLASRLLAVPTVVVVGVWR